MRKKAINIQVLLESACYLIFAAMLLYLVFSGGYLRYVTPRMKPYLLLAAAVMLLWALLSLPGLFAPQYRKRTAHCFVLVIPALLLFLPHGEMGISNLSGSTSLLTGSALTAPGGQGGGPGVPTVVSPLRTAPPAESAPGATSAPTASPAPEVPAAGPTAAPSAPPVASVAPANPGENNASAALPPAATTSPADDAPRPTAPDGYMSTDLFDAPVELHGYDAAQRTVTVSSEEFDGWLNEFFMNADHFLGFQVTMTGAVYKDPASFAADEFVPARLMMSCCVADLAPTGLVCSYEQAAGLESDTWLTVTGTLFIGQYEGQEVPKLKITAIAPADPVEGYIYPY